MTIAPDGRPPFRADHIGSLLRPAELQHAFRDVLARRIDEGKFRAIQDAAIRGVVRLQEEVGLQVVNDGEYRRGSYWGRFVELTDGLAVKEALYKFHDDHGHELDFTAPHVAGRVRRGRPIAVDEIEFVRGVTKATPKVTLPAPSTMHFYRGRQYADPGVYESPQAFFADLGQRLPGGDRGARALRRALRPARRGRARDALRPASAREGRGRGRGPGGARRPVRRRDQPGGREPAGGHGDRRAHVPRQLQGPVPRPGRLRLGRGAALPAARTSTTSCSSTTRRAPETSRRCASCRRRRGSCSGWSARRWRRWRSSTS